MSNPSEKRTSRKVSKPPKPYPEFPLTAHNGGYWMKKIRGKIHYFGKWGKVVGGVVQRLPGDGWQEALKKYKEQIDDLQSGRTPRVKNPDGLTLAELANRFLTSKLRKKAAGELSPRTFYELKKTTDRLIDHLGKERLVDDIAASDFGALRAEIAKTCGPVRLSNEITRVKSVFKHAFDNGLIQVPVRYGSEFNKPDKSVLRRHKATSGPRVMDAETIRKLIEKANPPMRAMILLAVNCGFGNTDLANVQQRMIGGDWVDFPRPKTGIPRRCPLWSETKEAIQAAIAARPSPKLESDADCVFLTRTGQRWVKVNKTSRTDIVANEFGKLAKAAGVPKGVGIYSLRHMFQTVADGARDPVAVKMMMGHADATMSGTYREFVADENLIAVSNHVRAWLFGTEGGAE